jgi:hypothetical protein
MAASRDGGRSSIPVRNSRLDEWHVFLIFLAFRDFPHLPFFRFVSLVASESPFLVGMPDKVSNLGGMVLGYSINVRQLPTGSPSGAAFVGGFSDEQDLNKYRGVSTLQRGSDGKHCLEWSCDCPCFPTVGTLCETTTHFSRRPLAMGMLQHDGCYSDDGLWAYRDHYGRGR